MRSAYDKYSSHGESSAGLHTPLIIPSRLPSPIGQPVAAIFPPFAILKGINIYSHIKFHSQLSQGWGDGPGHAWLWTKHNFEQQKKKLEGVVVTSPTSGSKCTQWPRIESPLLCLLYSSAQLSQ